jgi:hypothetical protein
MGRVLHGSAHNDRSCASSAIQHSQASLKALARRYGINQETVAKWKRCSFVAWCSSGTTLSD